MEIDKNKITVRFKLFVLIGFLIVSLIGVLLFVKKSDYLEENLDNGATEKENINQENTNKKLDTNNDELSDTVGQNNFVASDSLAMALISTSTTSSDLPVALSGPAIFKEEVSLSNKNWKYSFYAPADLDMNKEQVLIIGLHGFEDNAKDYIKHWQSDADKNDFLVAALQAYPKTYPSGSTVESYPWLEISDFIKAVLANIEKKYKINENKIFLTGYSDGAVASYIIALDSGIKFRGVIPIDGYLPLEAGIIDKLSRAKDVDFYVAHSVGDAGIDAVINQEKILLQYGAKMEFKILSDVLIGEYPAGEHENILKWMEGLK